MKKKEIKKILRENTINLKEVGKQPKEVINNTTKEEDTENKDDKILKLLNNDVINHAAVVRKMTGEEWIDNSEATNRSKFRKKLNKFSNDEGSNYFFDEDEVGQIEKILMSLSSTIDNAIGRQGR
tara:strand:+ start:90 stop:464 length:375 start_codon:yes stop_codon:yes gene_type:complete